MLSTSLTRLQTIQFIFCRCHLIIIYIKEDDVSIATSPTSPHIDRDLRQEMAKDPNPLEYAVQVRRRIREGDEDALQLGPRKKAYVRYIYLLIVCPQQTRYRYFRPSCLTDPLVHHGRHFGRTEHALCNVRTLLTNGLVHLRLAQAVDNTNNTRAARDRCVYHSVICLSYVDV